MLIWIRVHGKRLVRFGFVGATATATHYAVALIFVEAAGLHVQIANLIGFWFAFFVSYLGQTIFTFKTNLSWINLSQYLLLAGFNYGISAVALQAISLALGVSHRVSLLIVVAIIPITSYLISQKFIFRK